MAIISTVTNTNTTNTKSYITSIEPNKNQQQKQDINSTEKLSLDI